MIAWLDKDGDMESMSAVKSAPSQRLWQGIWRWAHLALLTNLAAFGLGMLVFLSAPFLALSWGAKPFLGVLVEHTLVVSGIRDESWSGAIAGLDYPQRIFRIADQLVNTPSDYAQAVSRLTPGTQVVVQTVLPDGTSRMYPGLEVTQFPASQYLRLFWLPYLVGLAYLVIGLWVFLKRGKTAAGRAFSFFCVSTAIVNGLLFDLQTTHYGTWLWTIALSQIGGSLVSLALVFPYTWSPVKRQGRLRYLPYLGSAVLSIWGFLQLREAADPWSYVIPWRLGYLYASLGIVIFLALLLYRQRTSAPGIARQQARIILWGSLVAFVPVTIWLVAPLFSKLMHFNPGFFVPLLLAFPLSVGIAILRYRLWDLDVVINRTLVYGLVSLILIAVYLAIVLLVHRMFNKSVELTSEITSVASALVIVALFNPLRRRVQDFIDRRFYRRKYDAAKTLAAFIHTLQAELDLTQLLDRLASVIWDTIMPARVLIWLKNGSQFHLTPFNTQQFLGEPLPPLEEDEIAELDPIVEHFNQSTHPVELNDLELTTPGTQILNDSEIKLAVPLINQGELLGWLGLGRRMSAADYGGDDRDLLANLAMHAAPAVRVAQLVQQQRVEALQRERFEHELRLARDIQQALLPKRLPDLDGWQISAHYQPARAVGGDFYDFINLEDGRLGIFIGDVTDKGVPAALVMATTRTLLRAVAQHVTSPGQVLAQVNNMLEQEIPDNMFVTCLYLIIDPHTGRMRFSNAGHNLPVHSSGSDLLELRATGLPLGLMSDVLYEEKEAVIHPGDCLCLYSDGLIEAHNHNRDMFGTERLKSVMVAKPEDEFSLIEELLDALHDFTGVRWEQEDDVTLVTLKRPI